MRIYELSHFAASHLITNAPADLRYLMLRANAQRWTGEDLHDLLEQLPPGGSLSIWKFTRILTDKDGALGKAAERLRKDQGAVWEVFGKWPTLQQFSRNPNTPFLVGDKSFVYGSIELNTGQSLEVQADLLSLINYSGFAETGLMTLSSPSETGLSLPSSEAVVKLLQLVMTCKSKKYASQEDWDQDLRPKEEALLSAAEKLLSDRVIPVILLLNANVEVSLLAICREELEYFRQRPDSVRNLEDEKIREWEVGIFR
jgi:hypothetical protein